MLDHSDVVALSNFTSGFVTVFLLLFWHAPLGVRSTKCRHQSPKWTILRHVSCFIQREVVGFQVLLDSLHPRSTRELWTGGLLQFSKGAAVKILASVSSDISQSLLQVPRVKTDFGRRAFSLLLLKSGIIYLPPLQYLHHLTPSNVTSKHTILPRHNFLTT